MSSERLYLKNSGVLELKILQLLSSLWEVSRALGCSPNVRDAFLRTWMEISQNCLWEDARIVDFTPRELKLAKNVWCFALPLQLFIKGSQSTFQTLTDWAPQLCIFWKFSIYQLQPFFFFHEVFNTAVILFPWDVTFILLQEGRGRVKQAPADCSRTFPTLRKKLYSFALPLMQTGSQAT